MVQFNKLRLSGFKSFVDATELVIAPGLTGVVGPNGCGKSNLVEALRWAMGETSAKQLRGGEMDEVIFGGTRDRPARNIAEVSLVLGNEDRKATAQFNDQDELEITRRIEREKGSLYRVNGREVRARDVQLLFADVATGARSTALVSQGRIGAIINAKPAQRRHLLEEAAGITGLHSRRHEAELRLQAAETNLNRLNDVITALEAQLEGLKKQARQAVRYRTVSESIRAAEALVLTIRREAAVTELAAARAAFAESENAVTVRTGVAAEAATAQANAASVMPELRKTEAEAAARRSALAIARDKLDEELERVARAREAAEMRLAQIRDDIARETARLADAEEALTRLGAERDQLNAATAAEADDLERAREALKTAAKVVEAVEEELTLLNKKLAEAEAARAGARQQLNEADLRRQRAERRIDDMTQQIETARQSALAPEVIAAEESRASTADTAAETARAAWEASEQNRAAAQGAYEAARDVHQTAATAHTRLQAEAVALEELLAEPRTPGAWSPIIDSVAVDPGFEAALGAALGDDLTAAGDDTAPLRWSLLPPFLEVSPLPMGARPLSEVVRAPNRLTRRLSQVGVVADQAAGSALQGELKPGQRLVTAAGDLWRWDGFISASGAPTATATRLKQRNRLKELRELLEGSAAALREAETAAEAAKRAVATAQGDETTARANVRATETERNAARDALGVLRQKVAALQSRLAGLDDSRTQLQHERDEALAQIATANERLTALGDGTDLRDEVETKGRGLAGLRQDLMEARAAYDSLTRQADERARRRTALNNEANSWSARRDEANAQSEALRQRQVGVEEEIAALAGRPAEIEAQRSALMDQLNVAEDARRQAADALAAGETTLTQADKALKDAEHELSGAREDRVRRESAVNQAEQALSVIDGNIREKIGCEPEETRSHTRLEADEAPIPLEQAEKRLQRLVSERDNLGAINLRAEQESNELSEQINGLVTERDDLIAAIARLREGIAKLNKEGRDRLLKSFNEVDGHFRNLFTKLFGGGRAHLELTEAEDPLEAGLEIMASPPGKRLGNLALMSGGEQALTALALLFAVFMTNPAPICVLDEVDAPLDDANVDRFCSLLTDITGMTGTRALVVTHHRMTMARMDRLFGVTMAERGVSRLVSVDLKAAEELRDSAA
ncbi:MAG: chromosome segregation protein SMC [Rhodospirillaceae bacterium]|nr:MAG: chromosome segregation protein SMC [Rhodospirillaceae bacterium]